MKAYLVTTSVIFGLLVVVHIWRMLAETGSANPLVIGVTLLAGAMFAWAVALLKQTGASRG